MAFGTAYRTRIRNATLSGHEVRVAGGFWLLGLINNLFYVVILSAALDLVGPLIPKATVLLSSIIPGLLTKLVVPYVIHLVPYSIRIIVLAALSTCGMLIVALGPGVIPKVAGIVLANVSSGAGEVNFLALTHFYGTTSLAAWGSGTGGAGLIGAGAYALATTTFGFSVQSTLLASAVIPLGMLLSFFCLLPLGPLKSGGTKELAYESVPADENVNDDDPGDNADLLEQPDGQTISPAYEDTAKPRLQRLASDLKSKLGRTRYLVIPYMGPLFLVYFAEYTINQGVAPTLLFPLERSPFKHFRDFYPAYGAIYQIGVFLSRSSLPFFRIRSLYIPSVLQVVDLVALTVHALFPYIPTVWFVFAVIFWEGILGGLTYVNTYAAVNDEVAKEDREFALAVVPVSDSAGIFVAGLLGVVMESLLCSWQVRHGRDWCRQL